MQTNVLVIEQQAIVTSLGNLQQTTESLLAGELAIRPGPCFSVPVAYAPFKATTPRRGLATAAAALKEEFSASDAVQGDVPLFIYAAAKGDLQAFEPASSSLSQPATSPLLSEQAKQFAELLGIRSGRIMAVSNACASGAVAIATAKLFLEAGLFTTAVVAGYDVVSRFVTTGFHALGALSPTGAKPFDSNRDGLTLGDGAACTVLRYRKPHPGDIYIAGAASTNDANHRTGPSRTGEGLYRAAKSAIINGQGSIATVGAVKCHGTATRYNDAMEAKAVNKLFSGLPPPCFSVKGAIGHTSGAGSLIELILAAAFLKRRMIPPTVGFSQADPTDRLPLAAQTQQINHPSLLCLSAGFGGLNSALFIKEVAAP